MGLRVIVASNALGGFGTDDDWTDFSQETATVGCRKMRNSRAAMSALRFAARAATKLAKATTPVSTTKALVSARVAMATWSEVRESMR